MIDAAPRERSAVFAALSVVPVVMTSSMSMMCRPEIIFCAFCIFFTAKASFMFVNLSCLDKEVWGVVLRVRTNIFFTTVAGISFERADWMTSVT